MKPAARVGDQTAHGSPLGPGPGSSRVLIGSKPAFRALVDTHTCPLSSPNPHGSGVVPTSLNQKVRVGGSLLACVGDSVAETGGANAIVNGASNVFVG